MTRAFLGGFGLALACATAPASNAAPSDSGVHATHSATSSHGSSAAQAHPTSAPARSAPKPPHEPSKLRTEPIEPIALADVVLARSRKVQRIVDKASAEHGLDPNLLNGVIWVESKFNPKARNKSGAKGLMQLMPKTGQAMARALGRRHRPYDPEFSVHAGAKLLSILLGKFDGDEELALFGYARGGGRVRRYQREGGEIPEGVQKFIVRVRRAQHTFEQLGFPGAAIR